MTGTGFEKAKSRLKGILPGRVWKLLRGIRVRVRAIPFYIFRLIPVQKRRIVFSNFLGKGFGDNGKYIALELLRQGRKYDLVWLVSDMSDKSFPAGIRLVKINSLKGIYAQVTARVWVDNCRKPVYVRKRKNQFYIQTWHGDLPIKKIERDAEGSLSETGYIECAKNDSKMADLMLAGSRWTENLYRRSFWYDGEILVCGSPKSEQLIGDSKEISQKVKNYFGISSEEKLVMFAPTFRNTDAFYQYDFDYELIKSAVEKKFGGKWTFIKRYHPNISEIERNENDIAHDATHYPDMQELLIAADILITDYSSTMFETTYNKHKICFLYAADISEYDRGFYFDLKKLPFSMSETLSGLEKNILDFNSELYQMKVAEIRKKLGFLETPHGAKSCAQRIQEVVFGVKE